MEGTKRRKRKNDRVDANKLARVGRMDTQSLFPIDTEVRQDLVVLRARDALVAARTQLINTTRGLVKSVGARLPKCSSPSFPHKAEEAARRRPPA
jgi:transposase